MYGIDEEINRNYDEICKKVLKTEVNVEIPNKILTGHIV